MRIKKGYLFILTDKAQFCSFILLNKHISLNTKLILNSLCNRLNNLNNKALKTTTNMMCNIVTINV